MGFLLPKFGKGVIPLNLEYLQELKRQSGLTVEQIADLSGVTVKTLNRIFSGETENPGFQNVADIVKALHGSLDEMAMIQVEEDVPMEHESESRLILLYREIIRGKDKWIRTLAIALGSVMVIVMFLLVFDIMNPTVGWFQR